MFAEISLQALMSLLDVPVQAVSVCLCHFLFKAMHISWTELSLHT